MTVVELDQIMEEEEKKISAIVLNLNSHIAEQVES